MANPYLEKERFTRDHERPSFAIYQECEICHESLLADDLIEGKCFTCQIIIEHQEKEYYVIVPSQHKCLTSKRGLAQVESWLIEMTGKHDLVQACEQLGAIIVSEVE
jgi:hypothetical protein